MAALVLDTAYALVLKASDQLCFCAVPRSSSDALTLHCGLSNNRALGVVRCVWRACARVERPQVTGLMG